ncbi:MAG: dienelactone hydrolase family protein [Chitinophagaceae bacterium]|nr:MAG: dienelactone hydrolase family protein [Chitinophagaceae bacterium]
MYTKATSVLFCCFAAALLSCNNQSEDSSNAAKESTSDSTKNELSVKEDQVSYDANGTTLKSYVAYDDNKKGPRPIVLIVPEWWGLTDYPRMRAKQLAEMGYLAMAVDMYGDGKLAENPNDAQSAAMPFYQDPQLGKARLDAALAKAKSLPQADTTQVVAIGYCFGGSMVLNYAKMGAPVAGVVSFHGGLEGVPPQKGTKAQFLVCHGAADNFVPEQQVAAFKKSMDSAGLNYTFKVYDSATHAFTNPDATAKGQKFNMPIKYNGAADTASWNDMKAFFGRILH